QPKPACACSNEDWRKDRVRLTSIGATPIPRFASTAREETRMCAFPRDIAFLRSLLVFLAKGCTTLRPQAAADSQRNRITVLYDAFGKNPAMKKDWGYAALVEVGGRRILFDTGDNPEIFAQNVKAAGVDLKSLDFV